MRKVNDAVLSPTQSASTVGGQCQLSPRTATRTSHNAQRVAHIPHPTSL